VAEVAMRGTELNITLRAPESLGDPPRPLARASSRVPAIGDDALLASLEQRGVELRVEAETGLDGWTVARYALLWLAGTALFVFFQRGARMMGGFGPGSQSVQSFLDGHVKRADRPQVTFADVAGQAAAKQEIQDLVEYLRDPQRFRVLGAEVPRGVLLMGPPGTGKTLLARALAGEAGVPFFSISGSQFIEMFVGVGASRVRSLFAQARRSAPCIVFIDELDAVGRTRGTGLGGGNDEREQTLNQILSEMDGFEPRLPIIVLAATNRPDVLDPALLRPGRFDRHVTLDLPSRTDRLALLQLHVRRVPLADGVDLESIAAATPGFSGADLKNLVNEAAMQAVRDRAEQISARHLDDARDKVVLGTARTLAVHPAERHRLAVHEAGHAAVAHFLPLADPPHRISIIPRGRALGATEQLPEQERQTLPEDYLQARLAVMLAGRTAEREWLGSISSGADDDIRQATALARAMVARWGMSETIGPVDLRDAEEHPFLGREIAAPRRFSEASARRVDVAVQQLLRGAESRARAVLREHHPALDRLIAGLEAEEQLDLARIEALLGARPVRGAVPNPTMVGSRAARAAAPSAVAVA
jgi:cell division protease FtsH